MQYIDSDKSWEGEHLQFILSSKTVQSHSSSLRTIDQSHRLATIFVAYLALVIGHVEVDTSFFE